MLPQYHALVTAAAALPLARCGWNRTDLALFLGAAVLVDVDHYLGYVWTTGDLSLRRAYALHRNRYRYPRRWRFRPRWPTFGFEPGRAGHALPFVALLFVAGCFWPALRPVAWGVLFHRLQDEAWGSFD
ncbi:MAG: hypothetical protein ACRDJN_08745 [Chloroflexota bacterium]